MTMIQKIDPRIVSDKEKRNRKSKMANYRIFPVSLLICVLLVNQFQDINASVLTVQKGVYKRLTVRVSEAVPRQLCHRAINNLQKILTSTSRSLYDTTTSQPGLIPGQFRDITIILPGSWAGTECLLGRNISVGSNTRYPFSSNSHGGPLLSGVNRPDFIVSGDDPIFGARPSVNEQFGQCGTGGRSGVNIPFKVLTQSLNVTKDSEIETFREWMRYRYGVFPETGFEGDEKYPSQYEFGGEMRGSYGCKDLARSISRKPKQTSEQSYTKSYNSEYKYDLSQTVSHVTVPFLPNDETNGDGPQLKLEEFSTTSFKGVEIGDAFVGKLASSNTNKKALCDIDLYDYNAPTKQNILCNRKSVREVLRDHPDFSTGENLDKANVLQTLEEGNDLATKIRNKDSFDIEISSENNDNENVENETTRPEYLPLSSAYGILLPNDDQKPFDLEIPAFVAPKFTLVLPSRKRYILVLDVSKGMDDVNGFDRRWEKTRNALFRFIQHIKEGDEVGIISFGAKARQNIKATVVTNSNREGLLGRVPFKLQTDTEVCMSCALQMVEKMISTPSSADGLPASPHVVIISAGSNKNEEDSTFESSDELKHFKDLIEMKTIPIYNIVFEGVLSEEVRQLSMYGQNYVVPRTKNASLLQNLADIFISILNLSNGSSIRKAYERYFFWEARQGETQISGNFVVEENLRNNLWMILTTPFKEDVDYFEVTSPSGTVHVLPVAENGIVYFKFKELSEAGIWSYKVKLHPFSFSYQNVAVSIEVFGEETTDSDAVEVESWTSVDIKVGANPLEKPVIIYAKVKQGQLPVRDAEVTATIYRPEFSTPFEVTLTDSGTGYPDITSGDGIYSAYFTGFTAEPGLYSLVISVNNDADSASVPKLFGSPLIDANSECCGSSFGPRISTHDSLPTGQFQRMVVGPSFHVNEGVEFYMNKNGEPQVRDIFPPSRITDLSIMGYVNGTLYATLKWSSPGGDYDQNKAERYEIRKYTNPNALTSENFEHGDILIPVHESLLPIPAARSGQEQSATVGLPWANEIFYYAIVAIDAVGNRGEVSNIVPVYAEEITTANSNSQGNGKGGVYNTDGTDKFTTAVLEAFNSHDLMIYIVAGIVCGLLLIVSIIIFVSCCRCRNRAKDKKKKQDQAHQRTQSFVNDLEATCQGNDILPPPASEKKPLNPLSYSDVWMTQNSGHNLGLPSPHVNMDIDEDGSNHTPTSDELLMYNGSSQQPSVSNSSHYHSNQQQWREYYNQTMQSTSPPPAYNSENGASLKGQVAPVHQYRLGSCGGSGSYREDPTIALGETEIDGVAVTYQNWTKPPSDNGTATTSSTECTSTYETDLLEKNKNNGTSNNTQCLNGSNNVAQPHHTPDAYSVHVPPTSLGTSNGRRYSDDLSGAISPMSYHHQGSSFAPNGSSQFMDPVSLSLSPNFSTNVKRKRNESLV